MYLVAFVVLLPLSLWAALRAGRSHRRRRRRASALTALCALLAGSLAGILIVVRLSAGLPWGDGLVAVLVAVLLWAAGAGAALWRAGEPWEPLERLAPWASRLCVAAAVLWSRERSCA